MATPNASFDDVDQLDDLLAGKSKPTAAEKERLNRDITWATKLVADFKAQSNGGGAVWSNLSRDKVADGLRGRLIDSTEINQAETWLCGVTSAVRAWAEDFPVDYAWLGIQLFNTGRGRLGRGKMLGEIIESSLDLRRSSVPNGMDHADWLILAAVHETLGRKYGLLGHLSYTSNEGNFHSRAWQTANEVMAAYKGMGYKNVVDTTQYVGYVGINNLEKANEYLRNGYRVSLLINARLLSDDTLGTRGLIDTSDHWVGMLEPFSVIGDNLAAFKVFSWGKRKRVPAAEDKKYLLVKDFLVSYHGFVAARGY